MLSFLIKDTRIFVRTAGCAVCEDRVLLQRLEGENRWFAPGGRVEINENAELALVCGMHEALDAELELDGWHNQPASSTSLALRRRAPNLEDTA